jgi:crossover junction endodeoxyribonuclease RuvC
VSIRVVGLDLSLASTGVVIAEPGSDPRAVTVGSDKVDSTDFGMTHQRLVGLTARILAAARADLEPGTRVLYVLEEPAFSRIQGQAHTRAGLWWLVYHFAAKEGTVVTAQIQHVKQYATGKGNANKTDMLLAADRSFPRVGVVDDNQADAAWLAAMGMRELGHPFEVSVQRCHPQHLAKQRWPVWVREYRETH